MKKNEMAILDLCDYASTPALQKPSYQPFLNDVDYENMAHTPQM